MKWLVKPDGKATLEIIDIVSVMATVWTTAMTTTASAAIKIEGEDVSIFDYHDPTTDQNKAINAVEDWIHKELKFLVEKLKQINWKEPR